MALLIATSLAICLVIVYLVMRLYRVSSLDVLSNPLGNPEVELTLVPMHLLPPDLPVGSSRVLGMYYESAYGGRYHFDVRLERWFKETLKYPKGA